MLFQIKRKCQALSWKVRSANWKIIELFICITKPFSFSATLFWIFLYAQFRCWLLPQFALFCFSEIYRAKYLTKAVPVSAEMQVCMVGLGTQQWSLMPNPSPLYLYCCRHNRCRCSLFWKPLLFSINLVNASAMFFSYEMKPIVESHHWWNV